MGSTMYKPHDEMFSELKKFIEHYSPDIQELIMQGVKLYIKDAQYIQEHYCMICDKRLSEQDKAATSIFDFTITCLVHREHASVFQFGIIRKQLGIRPRSEYIEGFVSELI